MKKSIILALLFCACFSLNISAQAPSVSDSIAHKPTQEETNNFILFRYLQKTDFLKLDTRSGVITWLCYYSSSDSKSYEESSVNPTPLVPEEEQIPGRFILYQTNDEHEYAINYILLDKITGEYWLVSELRKKAKE